eukprot:TRINITY_DN7547_c0_g2_i3.p1 TRINITY_DN7547_c0_g2~~TRINITY_DN7547_c0_g2_i3.p1  ORF type:complete len:838 (-),score=220.94 TRINITY_DN7547_c0_g2_i3:424-2937(-)
MIDKDIERHVRRARLLEEEAKRLGALAELCWTKLQAKTEELVETQSHLERINEEYEVLLLSCPEAATTELPADDGGYEGLVFNVAREEVEFVEGSRTTRRISVAGSPPTVLGQQHAILANVDAPADASPRKRRISTAGICGRAKPADGFVARRALKVLPCEPIREEPSEEEEEDDLLGADDSGSEEAELGIREGPENPLDVSCLESLATALQNEKRADLSEEQLALLQRLAEGLRDFLGVNSLKKEAHVKRSIASLPELPPESMPDEAAEDSTKVDDLAGRRDRRALTEPPAGARQQAATCPPTSFDRGNQQQPGDDDESEELTPIQRRGRKAKTETWDKMKRRGQEAVAAQRMLGNAATLSEAGQIYKKFLDARTVGDIANYFSVLWHFAEDAQDSATEAPHWPYQPVGKLPGLPWKAAKIRELLDARVNAAEYQDRPLHGFSLVVIGCGPVGLRVALEAALCGADVTLLEKRDEFTRINRLHLWEWVKQDLTAWGAKVFSPPGGTFGADKDYCHIGIGELQYLLLKCCLLLGVDIEFGVAFTDAVFVEGVGWTAQTDPPLERESALCIDALICCDGAASAVAHKFGTRAILGGIKKEGQAIGIVANFVNKKTKADRDTRQFSWARQFNGPLFSEVKTKLGADLENIVYYRGDENHYMIMTPTKQSLLQSGCLFSNEPKDGHSLLHASNVNMVALQTFAKGVAGHFGLPTEFMPTQSVMAFDFSDTKRQDQAVLFHDPPSTADAASPLVVCLAGDALLEPFWPTGLGCVRGFLGALDCLSSLVLWAKTKDKAAVLSHAESAYRMLKSVDSQTKDKTLRPDSEWRLHPSTRYRGFKR